MNFQFPQEDQMLKLTSSANIEKFETLISVFNELNVILPDAAEEINEQVGISTDLINNVRELESKIQDQWRERQHLKNLKQNLQKRNNERSLIRSDLNNEYQKLCLQNQCLKIKKQMTEYKCNRLFAEIEMLSRKTSFLETSLTTRRKELQELQENEDKVNESFDRRAEQIKSNTKELESMLEQKRQKIATIREQNNELQRKMGVISRERSELLERSQRVCLECTNACTCTIDDFMDQPITDELKLRTCKETNVTWPVVTKPPVMDACIQTGPNLLCYIYEQNDGLLADTIALPVQKRSLEKFRVRFRHFWSKFTKSTDKVSVLPDKTVQVKLDDNLVVETVSSNIRYYNRELKHGLRRMSMPGVLPYNSFITESDNIENSTYRENDSQTSDL